jgi:hypothetical protein
MTDQKLIEMQRLLRKFEIPPKREWVGLTDEEKEHYRRLGLVGVEIIEAKLKEKNHDS